METGATHDDLVKFRDGIIDFAVDDALDGITMALSLIHISEPTRLLSISYAVFCLKKKKKTLHTTPND